MTFEDVFKRMRTVIDGMRDDAKRYDRDENYRLADAINAHANVWERLLEELKTKEERI